MTHFEPGSPTPPPVPIPVQPLTYSVPWERQVRPGLITTIGVMCIVVACLSGFISFFLGFYGFIFYSFAGMASRSATVASSSSVSMTTSVNGSAGPQADEKMPMGDVSVADNALGKLLALDGPRQRELDKLLRTHGKAVFPPDDDNDDATLTSAAVRTAVKEHQGAPDDSGAAHFTTAAGGVDVYPTRATFTSADGGTTIDTSAAANSESTTFHATSTTAGPVASTQGAATTLTPAQVRQIMNSIKRLAPQPLSTAQLNAIQAQLAAPNQQLVTNPAGAPVVSVMSQGPNVMVQFDSGMLTVAPQGQVVFMNTYGPTAFAVGAPTLGLAGWPIALLVFECVASVALAVYLLIVGIMVFRASFKSPRRLRIYACIKIPLALITGIAFTWIGLQIVTTAASGNGFPYVVLWACILTALGLAFPIGLLFALRTRTAREYFNSVVPS